MIKPVAIGRGNWLFVGSESGGHRAAILLRIVGSAKHSKVEPWAWLNAVLKELPAKVIGASQPDNSPDLSDLLPAEWLKSHPQVPLGDRRHPNSGMSAFETKKTDGR